jgi:hypothetical protein
VSVVAAAYVSAADVCVLSSNVISSSAGPTIDDPSAFVATGTFASCRSSPASTVGSQATDRTVYP